jgi:hypothetical protein
MMPGPRAFQGRERPMPKSGRLAPCFRPTGWPGCLDPMVAPAPVSDRRLARNTPRSGGLDARRAPPEAIPSSCALRPAASAAAEFVSTVESPVTAESLLQVLVLGRTKPPVVSRNVFGANSRSSSLPSPTARLILDFWINFRSGRWAALRAEAGAVRALPADTSVDSSVSSAARSPMRPACRLGGKGRAQASEAFGVDA